MEAISQGWHLRFLRDSEAACPSFLRTKDSERPERGRKKEGVDHEGWIKAPGVT